MEVSLFHPFHTWAAHHVQKFFSFPSFFFPVYFYMTFFKYPSWLNKRAINRNIGNDITVVGSTCPNIFKETISKGCFSILYIFLRYRLAINVKLQFWPQKQKVLTVIFNAFTFFSKNIFKSLEASIGKLLSVLFIIFYLPEWNAIVQSIKNDHFFNVDKARIIFFPPQRVKMSK